MWLEQSYLVLPVMMYGVATNWRSETPCGCTHREMVQQNGGQQYTDITQSY